LHSGDGVSRGSVHVELPGVGVDLRGSSWPGYHQVKGGFPANRVSAVRRVIDYVTGDRIYCVYVARMVGGEIFSEPQGPENLQNRSQPGQRPSLVIGGIAARQPVSTCGRAFGGEGKCRLGAVLAVGPAAKCRRIGHAICERRRCLFPGAVLHQAPAAMPDSAPANCSACKGAKNTGER